MRQFALVGFCAILFVVVSGRLGGGSKLSHSQAFLVGLHSALDLQPNYDVLNLVDNKAFSEEEVLVALGYLADGSSSSRFYGVSAFYKIFERLNKTLSAEISKDSNFTTVVSNAMVVLRDTSQFIYRAGVYQRTSHVNIYTVFYSAKELAGTGDFYNAGRSFGLVIRNLYDALTPDGSLGHIQPFSSVRPDPKPPIFNVPYFENFHF
eukprot:TRINITY_DN5947_c0_g1_i1.p1 TRINITY_DN5947_c0_g1~~TRINITY_DN5947_c0_g1_i1.p1  ORF type:complete len:207 (+),score=42.84 TRINITY_DN5947_c0_g1_i1:118-738(+)